MTGDIINRVAREKRQASALLELPEQLENRPIGDAFYINDLPGSRNQRDSICAYFVPEDFLPFFKIQIVYHRLKVIRS